MKFNQKQIWLINFEPSFGHEYRKMRLGLIIESSYYIELGNLITVIPISSKIDRPKVLDVTLLKTTRNRLMSDPLLKIQQISSFDKRRFVKLIGICDDEVFENVKENMGNTYQSKINDTALFVNPSSLPSRWLGGMKFLFTGYEANEGYILQ